MSDIGIMGSVADQEAPEGLTPIPLFEIVQGGWAASTLAAALELELFEKTATPGGLTREEVAQELGIEDRPADILLAACASLGLLTKVDERYRNSPISDEFLVKGRTYYFGGFIRYADRRRYPGWQELPTALRTNRPTTWDPDEQESVFDRGDQLVLSMFWEAMHSMSSFTGRVMARALPMLSERKALLDVGGGSGALVIEACKAVPTLRAGVFELPHVCEIAARKIAAAGLEDRITTEAGDFIADSTLPGGYDTISLSAVLHDWDETTGRAILGKCFRALPAGGVIIVLEDLLDDDRSGPRRAALVGVNMLVETQGGKNYSGSEYTRWLTDTGFTDVQRIRCESVTTNSIIVAQKP
ncbi:acetylserotonin O-methyltransferase [Nocardia sp. CDC159]|uniref:Acetylserotonin O-methyltransferase n=1 Tax=Nocardia pulmonis TaxID=2951408 RepID=A0A9X2E5H8_9NOCA|nr:MULTISPECIES: acetylserotonin O-methyltransferase [Nocardia]MCM6774497.1 acetylserotonin O-methyltransferase [Nocardia pulmonis]MCM6787437.1 acetylserotonin O-methyltransferase [Nocardia sp. CDC159]